MKDELVEKMEKKGFNPEDISDLLEGQCIHENNIDVCMQLLGKANYKNKLKPRVAKKGSKPQRHIVNSNGDISRDVLPMN